MYIFLIAIILLIVFFVFVKIFGFSSLVDLMGNTQNSKETKWPYRRKDYLLSIAERNFYDVLSKIAGENNYLLFAKVRLEDLLWLPAHTENRFGLRSRIKSRHMDFVLCNKESIRPLLAIELDDSSHEREDRKERDYNIDNILRDAGLPILHVKAHQSYDPLVLKNDIAQKLK